MRRKDREQSVAFGLQVIDAAPFGTLCLADPADPALPYAVPLSLVRQERTLYFHAAKAGTKTELLRDGANVRVVFVSQAEVPTVYSDKDIEATLAAGTAGPLLSSVFTTEFRSAVVTGSVHPVADAAEHKSALERICQKYTPDKMAYFEAAYESGAAYTAVYRIEIETITAKAKRVER